MVVVSNCLYEGKIWGSREARLSMFNGYYLTLKYCLESLREVEGKVVDIGCAAGAFTAGIKQYRPDLKMTGVDISKACISIANKHYEEIEFIRGDLRELKYKEGELGGVTANHVLEHVADAENLLGEIYKVVKPGGIFYSATPLEGNWSAIVRWLRIIPSVAKNRIEYLGHLRAFAYKEYLLMFEKAGFKVEKIWWSGHLGYQVVDVGYHLLLKFLGMKADCLLEAQVGEDKGMKGKAYRMLRGILDVANKLEGVLLFWIPGFILHVKARKVEKFN